MKSEFEKVVYIARVGKGIFERIRENVTLRKKANQKRLFPLFRGRPRKKKILESFVLMHDFLGAPQIQKRCREDYLVKAVVSRVW